MSPNEPLAVLLAHDRWGTEQLIAACRPLSDAQVDRAFEIGRGSLRKTLVHMHNVVRGWDDSISGRKSASLEATASLNAIEAGHRAAYDALAETCAQGHADDVLTLARGPHSMQAPRGVVLTHILTHGTHTRAQALNMLRHLGITPLPPSSVLEWMRTTGVAQMG